MSRAFLPAGTNGILNPSFELDTIIDGVALADGWTQGGSITGTPTLSFVPGRKGGLAQRIQYTGVAGDAAGDKALTFFLITANAPACAPADVVQGSAYFRCANVGVTANLRHIAWDAAHGYVADATMVPIPNSADFLRITNPYTMPATTAYSTIWVHITEIGTGDVVDLTIDDADIQISPVPLPYFSGPQTWDAMSGCAWSGTPNASASTRTRSSLIFADKALVPNPWLRGTIAVRHTSLGPVVGVYRAIVGSELTIWFGYHTNGYLYLIINAAGALGAAVTEPAAGVPQTIVARWDWNSIEVTVDGVAAASSASVPVAVAAHALGIGSSGDAATSGWEQYGSISSLLVSSQMKSAAWAAGISAGGGAAFNDPLTIARDYMGPGDAVVPFAGSSNAYVKPAPASGLTQLVFDGDSNTTPNMGGVVCYPELLVADLGGDYDYANVAIGGFSWLWLQYKADDRWSGLYPLIDDLLSPVATKHVLVVMSGTNDFNGQGVYYHTAEGAWDCAVDYLQHRRTAGFEKIVILACLPFYPGVSLHPPNDYESRRQDYMDIVRANWSSVADVFVDFADDPYIGVATAFVDHPTYWMNEAHLSLVGRQHLADLVRAAIADARLL